MTLEELQLDAEKKRLLAKDYHDKLNKQFHDLLTGLVTVPVGVEVTTYIDVDAWNLKHTDGIYLYPHFIEFNFKKEEK